MGKDAKSQPFLTDEDHLAASRDMRELLQRLGALSIRYRDVARHTSGDEAWSSNSIKQIVARAGKIRPSVRIGELVAAIEKELSERNFDESEIATERALLKSARRVAVKLPKVKKKDLNAFAEHFIDRSRRLGEWGTFFNFARRYAFCRWDTEGKRIVTILVDLEKTSIGYIFSMKISGSYNNRRIVMGRVLFTSANTYFQGLAYEVNTRLNQHEFVESNPFDLKASTSIIEPNEIGCECIVIQNVDTKAATFPVSFQGLDGAGRPIVGVGAMINSTAFDDYNISEESFSSVACGDENNALASKLEAFQATTRRQVSVDDLDLGG